MTFYNIYAPTKADERIDFSNAFVAVLKDIKSEVFHFNSTENEKRDPNHSETHPASLKVLPQ